MGAELNSAAMVLRAPVFAGEFEELLYAPHLAPGAVVDDGGRIEWERIEQWSLERLPSTSEVLLLNVALSLWNGTSDRFGEPRADLANIVRHLDTEHFDLVVRAIKQRRGDMPELEVVPQ